MRSRAKRTQWGRGERSATEREKLERSQARRPTLNPIAWAASRKRIVRDIQEAEGLLGGGWFFYTVHTSCSLTVPYTTPLLHNMPQPTDRLSTWWSGRATRKPKGHKSIKTTHYIFYSSSHFVKITQKDVGSRFGVVVLSVGPVFISTPLIWY